MYFSRRARVIDSASHGNFANGLFRWFSRFEESWSYRSALRRWAYGGEMKALYFDVYIIVVYRNSPPPFFASHHLLPFLRHSHTLSISLFFCAPLFFSGFFSQASTFLLYSFSISIASVISYFICTVNFSLIEMKCCSFIWVYDDTYDYFILVSLSSSFNFSLFLHFYVLLYALILFWKIFLLIEYI